MFKKLEIYEVLGIFCGVSSCLPQTELTLTSMKGESSMRNTYWTVFEHDIQQLKQLAQDTSTGY